MNMKKIFFFCSKFANRCCIDIIAALENQEKLKHAGGKACTAKCVNEEAIGRGLKKYKIQLWLY